MKFNFFRNQKRIYMIPNWYGGMACFLFLFFTITGAYYSNNVIFLFAFVLISFLLISILQTAKNLRGIQITNLSVQNGFPGEKTKTTMQLINSKTEYKFGVQVQIKGQKNIRMIDELPGQDTKMISTFYHLPASRGPHKTKSIKISTDAPYGLFSGWFYIYPDSKFVVYPKPAGLPLEIFSSAGEGADFSELRSYVQGDSLHRISWKHSAKKDNLVLKVFKEEEAPLNTFALEDCPQSELENKLAQLALWIQSAEQQRHQYALKLSNSSNRLGTGEKHFHECLRQLGLYEK
jgi:uncharacterized protein (DUF58 family)